MLTFCVASPKAKPDESPVTILDDDDEGDIDNRKSGNVSLSGDESEEDDDEVRKRQRAGEYLFVVVTALNCLRSHDCPASPTTFCPGLASLDGQTK